MGCWDFEDESHSNWLHFVYSSNADDDTVEKYFRNVVYKSEYGEKLDHETRVDIYEMTGAYDYSKQKHRKIALI